MARGIIHRFLSESSWLWTNSCPRLKADSDCDDKASHGCGWVWLAGLWFLELWIFHIRNSRNRSDLNHVGKTTLGHKDAPPRFGWKFNHRDSLPLVSDKNMDPHGPMLWVHLRFVASNCPQFIHCICSCLFLCLSRIRTTICMPADCYVQFPLQTDTAPNTQTSSHGHAIRKWS